jgi:hypothetical protein
MCHGEDASKFKFVLVLIGNISEKCDVHSLILPIYFLPLLLVKFLEVKHPDNTIQLCCLKEKVKFGLFRFG